MLQKTDSNVRTVTTRYGKISYYADDRWVGRSLAAYGEYSEAEVRLWRRFVKPGWRVVDAGANIGYFSMALAALVGASGKVWAFEPFVPNVELLRRNTRKLKHVQVIERALHDTPDVEIPIQTIDELRAQPQVPLNYGGANVLWGTDKVLTTTLDHAIADQVDFIKMDIEGNEILALDAATKLLSQRPILYLEEHPQANGTVSAYIQKLGYVVYDHQPALFDADNYNNNPDDVFDGDCIDEAVLVSFNILCIPQEKLAEYQGLLDDLTPKLLKDRTRDMLIARVPKAPASISGKTGWAGVARLGGVGDDLIAASVCRPLKAMGLKVEMITQLPMSVVFENNPFIDKISNYSNDDLPKDDKWQQFFVTAGKTFDKFGHLSGSCEMLHAFFPVHPVFWWPAKVRRKIAAGSYLETVHEILDVPLTFGPLFFPTEAEHEQARSTIAKIQFKRPGPIIGWCMAGTRIDKIYPPAPFVLARLIRELDANVVMLAAPPPFRDFELCKQASSMVQAENGSLDGLFHAGSPSLENQTWPVRRILTMAQHCDLMIGPDTGPLWSVAFEPLPKIMLHSHASVDNITKHWVNTVSLHADPQRVPCWPCHRLHNDESTCMANAVGNGAACISDISPDTIIAHVKRLLTKEPTHA
jgi:FkbM family methyltransferase